MIKYNSLATDSYMRSVLTDALSLDEADNSLTALSTLTGLHPSLFPHERTFVRPDIQPGSTVASGVRFEVYGEDEIERTVRVPRIDLSSVAEAVESVLIIISLLIPRAA